MIVHIDMDMFYAAVEIRDQPHLKEKPMAVGSTAMLTTSNYKVFFIKKNKKKQKNIPI